MKQGEKFMREQYIKAFGYEYDCPVNKPPALPLYIAYQVALRKLKQLDNA